MHILKYLVATAALGALAMPASAIDWTFNDPVNQGQEVPPSGSPATGTAVGTYDDVTNMLSIAVNASGFLYARTGAHIHGPAPVGSNAGVLFNLGIAGAGGNYNNVNSNFALDAGQEADFLAGLYYVNIHTTDSPGGAIRGQLNPVPEPMTMAALGLGSLVLLRRRKRKI